MLIQRLLFAFAVIYLTIGSSEATNLTPRKDIFATISGFRPAISRSGNWIAEAGATSGTLLLTPSGIRNGKSRLINLNATRIYWYRWTSATADTLLVSCDKSGRTVIYQLTPATANLSPVIDDNEQPVMTIASPMNGYNFTFDRFKNSATGEIHDMDEQGQLVKVSRQSGGNALPAYLAIDDAYLNLRIGRDGQSIQYGREGIQRSELHLPARDLRQGGGLISVTKDGKAYVLATAGTDTLSLIELDIRTGAQRILIQEAVDVRRVVLNPRDMKPDAVEFEQGEPEWKVIDERVSTDLARLRNAGWGNFRIVDRSPNDRFWIVKFGVRRGAPLWIVYDRISNTLRPVRLASSSGNIYSDWQVDNFTLVRAGEPILRGYISLPRLQLCPNGRCPLVLKLHGGPSMRDYEDIDPERLWLLNRGIAVATINYRGSRGFGKLFESLDKQQWASGIPHDVEDGLEYILKTYPLDQTRVAIMGSSFSAYLALQLESRRPQFKCALIDSATTDLPAFVDDGLRNYGEKTDLIERLGDVRIPQVRADLLALSPVSHVERLKKLTLLQMQGGRDKITPPALNQSFISNMLAENPDFTYILFEDEGHGLTGARAEYYAIAEQFLGNCLSVPVEKTDRETRAKLLNLRIQGNKAFFN